MDFNQRALYLMLVERKWTPVKLWILTWSCFSFSIDERYYRHYESGNFAIRAGAYFSEFVKTDLILKHLYAHNFGKKMPHKSRARHQISLVPSYSSFRREQNRSVRARVSRKKIAISGFIRCRSAPSIFRDSR